MESVEAGRTMGRRERDERTRLSEAVVGTWVAMRWGEI
jgi:hypothetical protein